MDEKVVNLLKQNIGNLEEEMANHKFHLEQKDYFLVVAGIGGSSLDVVLTLKQGSPYVHFHIALNFKSLIANCKLLRNEPIKLKIDYVVFHCTDQQKCKT